jgi:hypothetical protein
MLSIVAALAVVDAGLRNATQERIRNGRTALGLVMPPVGHSSCILALAACAAQALLIVSGRHQVVSRPCPVASPSRRTEGGVTYTLPSDWMISAVARALEVHTSAKTLLNGRLL